MNRADPSVATTAAGSAGSAGSIAGSASGSAPGPDAGRASRARTPLRGLGALLAAVVLGATFALYLRPGLTIDLGAFLAFCGVR